MEQIQSFVNEDIMSGKNRFINRKRSYRPALMPEETARKFAELFRLQQQLYQTRHQPEEKQE